MRGPISVRIGGKTDVIATGTTTIVATAGEMTSVMTIIAAITGVAINMRPIRPAVAAM